MMGEMVKHVGEKALIKYEKMLMYSQAPGEPCKQAGSGSGLAPRKKVILCGANAEGQR